MRLIPPPDEAILLNNGLNRTNRNSDLIYHVGPKVGKLNGEPIVAFIIVENDKSLKSDIHRKYSRLKDK